LVWNSGWKSGAVRRFSQCRAASRPFRPSASFRRCTVCRDVRPSTGGSIPEPTSWRAVSFKLQLRETLAGCEKGAAGSGGADDLRRIPRSSLFHVKGLRLPGLYFRRHPPKRGRCRRCRTRAPMTIWFANRTEKLLGSGGLKRVAGMGFPRPCVIADRLMCCVEKQRTLGSPMLRTRQFSEIPVGFAIMRDFWSRVK